MQGLTLGMTQMVTKITIATWSKIDHQARYTIVQTVNNSSVNPPTTQYRCQYVLMVLMFSENCVKVSPLLRNDVGDTTPACITVAIRHSALMFRRLVPEAQSVWVAGNNETWQNSHVHFCLACASLKQS